MWFDTFQKFFFYYLDAKILLAFIFLIFLICLNKFIVPFFKTEFSNSINRIKTTLYKYEQLFLYQKLIFLLLGSLFLTFLKKCSLIIIKINHLYLNTYINFYFYLINLIFLSVLNDFNYIFKLKVSLFNLNYFKNSLLNFFISYKLIFIK